MIVTLCESPRVLIQAPVWLKEISESFISRSGSGTTTLKSQASGRKIVIIFDAHKLCVPKAESANALLKILEVDLMV